MIFFLRELMIEPEQTKSKLNSMCLLWDMLYTVRPYLTN